MEGALLLEVACLSPVALPVLVFLSVRDLGPGGLLLACDAPGVLVFLIGVPNKAWKELSRMSSSRMLSLGLGFLTTEEELVEDSEGSFFELEGGGREDLEEVEPPPPLDDSFSEPREPVGPSLPSTPTWGIEK